MSSPFPDVPVFDPAAIEKLRKVAGDQDPGFVAEMATLFADETQKSMAELKSGVDRNDWKVVCRVAHSVKSSSATLGFMRLSVVCKALELNTQRFVADAQTPQLVASVFSEFDAVGPLLKGIA